MAGILDDNEETLQHSVQDTALDDDVLDVAIDHVIEALDTPSSSSDESSSSSDSSSDSSDSMQWGTERTRVLNPFATKAPKDGGLGEGGSTGGVENSINRTHILKKLSVTIQKLSNKVLRKFNCEPTTHTTNTCQLQQEDTMSAKNISKDRSGSRGKQDKQERFNKGRTGETQDDEDMGQAGDGQDNGAKGQGGAGAGQEIPSGKRPRDPPKTGTHDDTMGDSEDEEMPGAKRTLTSIREKLTHVYTKRTKERDEGRVKPSVAFRVDTSNAGEKIKTASVPLLAPTKLADAPTLSLKDLVPEADRKEIEDQGQDESFRSDRIEFVVVEREVVPGEEDKTVRPEDQEWEFPDRQMFDTIIGKAIDIYTEEDWELIDYMSFSSVGWNTGVGLFAFGSDKLEQMEKFREVLRNVKIGTKRFESYPKRMLLNRFAITIYFNAAFAWSTVPKLLFFFRKLNGFEGNLTMAETRHYPDDHPTRKGCKIVACEADQKFLDELYRYPKDHPFSIRYGGNLYVRGGERIDPDDPNAVRPRRPKLSRQAAKTFIAGSGEDILNEGQRQDDSAAERARRNYKWKDVSLAVLWDHNLIELNVIRLGIWGGKRLGPKHFVTTLMIMISRTRRINCQGNALFYVWGNGKVERQRKVLYVQIKAGFLAGRINLLMNECNYDTVKYDSNGVKLKIRIKCKFTLNKSFYVKLPLITWVIIVGESVRNVRGRSLNGCLTDFSSREKRSERSFSGESKTTGQHALIVNNQWDNGNNVNGIIIVHTYLIGDRYCMLFKIAKAMGSLGKTKRRRGLAVKQRKRVNKVRNWGITGPKDWMDVITVSKVNYHKKFGNKPIKSIIKYNLLIDECANTIRRLFNLKMGRSLKLELMHSCKKYRSKIYKQNTRRNNCF